MPKRVFSRVATNLIASSLAIAFALTLGFQAVNAQSMPDEVMTSYVAYIGTDDLYNSRGERLSSAAQVLRQDRANYHRFGLRQRGDESDALFDTAPNREVMTRIFERDGIDPDLARYIMSGNVRVYVEVWGHGNTVTEIIVDVY